MTLWTEQCAANATKLEVKVFFTNIKMEVIQTQTRRNLSVLIVTPRNLSPKNFLRKLTCTNISRELFCSLDLALTIKKDLTRSGIALLVKTRALILISSLNLSKILLRTQTHLCHLVSKRLLLYGKLMKTDSLNATSHIMCWIHCSFTLKSLIVTIRRAFRARLFW